MQGGHAQPVSQAGHAARKTDLADLATEEVQEVEVRVCYDCCVAPVSCYLDFNGQPII